MGIHDRDYMKRRSADAARRDRSSECNAEDFAQRFLQRHPRFFLYAGIGLAILVVIALLLAKFSP